MLLKSSEVEAANRAEATARLIRAGYKVFTVAADVDGVDFVIRTPDTQEDGLILDGSYLKVQQKGRLYVETRRYGERNIWLLFPMSRYEDEGFARSWCLIPHDPLYRWIERRHRHTQNWQRAWGYPVLPTAARNAVDRWSSSNWPNIPSEAEADAILEGYRS